MKDLQQSMQMKGPSLATIKSSPVFMCSCGGVTFTEKLTFRKLSALISPTGSEEMLPVPVFVCDKCGLAPAEFDTYSLVPEELKNNVKSERIIPKVPSSERTKLNEGTHK